MTFPTIPAEIVIAKCGKSVPVNISQRVVSDPTPASTAAAII